MNLLDLLVSVVLDNHNLARYVLAACRPNGGRNADAETHPLRRDLEGVPMSVGAREFRGIGDPPVRAGQGNRSSSSAQSSSGSGAVACATSA